MIFYDFEFQEFDDTIEPISLGMVRENNDEIYLINKDFVERQNDLETRDASAWIQENVLPCLYSVGDAKKSLTINACNWSDIIYDWLLENEPVTGNDNKWKLTGYYADYDHVMLSRLWGRMIDLPEVMPFWTRDLKQWIDDLGNPKIELPPSQYEHNALSDARWNRNVYKWLVQNYDHPAWRIK